MGEPLEAMMAEEPAPALSVASFNTMLNDVLSTGGNSADIVQQVTLMSLPPFPLN
jgi:hypothetical protein